VAPDTGYLREPRSLPLAVLIQITIREQRSALNVKLFIPGSNIEKRCTYAATL